MSLISQFLVLLSVSYFLMGCDKSESSTSDEIIQGSNVTTTQQPSASSDDPENWKEFNKEMQEMQNQINACPSWTKFASHNINQNGLYCQKNGQNYKCSSTPAGLNSINIGDCPSKLKVHRQLQAEDSQESTDEGMNELQELPKQIKACPRWTRASKNLHQNGLYCHKKGKNYKCESTPAGLNSVSVGSCPSKLKVHRQLQAEDSSESIAEDMHQLDELPKQIKACPRWTRVSNNLSKNGLYCQKKGKHYKCESTPAGWNSVIVGSCPSKLKVHRQLQAKMDSDDFSSDDSSSDGSSSDDSSSDNSSSDDAQEWKEFDQGMQEMQNQINACPSWTKFASSNINQNGLYCQQNGQNYKCSSTPGGLNGISVGGCPENLNTSNVVMI